MAEDDGSVPFIMTPDRVSDRTDLSDKAIRLYGLIFTLAQRDGFCFASNSYLAKRVQSDRKWISGVVQTLIEKGLIRSEVDKAAGNKRKLFPVLPIPCQQDSYPAQTGQGIQSQQGTCPAPTGNPIPLGQDQNIQEKRRKNHKREQIGAVAPDSFPSGVVQSRDGRTISIETYYLERPPSAMSKEWRLSDAEALNGYIDAYGPQEALSELSRRFVTERGMTSQAQMAGASRYSARWPTWAASTIEAAL